MRLVEWLGELARRFQGVFSSRAGFDRDLEDEMRLHRDLRAREFQETGAAPDESRYAAQRKFGNSLRLREEIHSAWGWTWLDTLLLDLRYALRRLRKSPGFTTVAVLTLALAIGANTAIFSLIQQVLLNPLPVPRPQELYSLGDDLNAGSWGGLQGDFTVYSYPLFNYLRDHTPEFSELAAFSSGDTALSVRRQGKADVARPFRGEFVSGNYFHMFGVDAAVGRLLEAKDDQRNARPVAVMSYRAWSSKFASSRELIGETLVIKGLPVTLIGIAPPDFFGDTLRTDPPDIYLPLSINAAMYPQGPSLLDQWNEHWLFAIGRLRSGVQPSQVQAHVTAELRQWLTENYVSSRYSLDPSVAGRYTKDISKQYIVVIPAAGGVAASAGGGYKEPLQLLMIVSALVLLIACANIANLLLARGAASRTQTAVRVALGASRGRILRQALTEGVLLALLGGAAGFWVAVIATRAILRLAFARAEYVPLHAGPSPAVLGFAFVVSLVTGLVFSAGPAWIASRTQPAEPMRSAARATRDHSGIPQKSLVALQSCISLVLLVGAGLLTLSLRRLETQPLGIETEGRLMAWVSISHSQYPRQRLESLYRQFQSKLSEIPGVLSVSFSCAAPLSGFGEPISIEGKPPVPLLEDVRWPRENRVSAHFFETVGTRVLRGRAIDEHDTPTSQHVAVVDEAFARVFLSGEDPIGKHFGIQTEKHNHDYEIVGVVESAAYRTAKRRAYPAYFLPLLQEEKYEDSAEEMEQADSKYVYNIQIRAAQSPDDFKEPVRRALAEIDPDLTVVRIPTFDEQVSSYFDRERLVARLTTLYGLLALALAAVGLYGVASYMTARRTNEIGIRMALGADRANVIVLMLRGSMRPIVIGLAVGVPAALAGARVIVGLLYGVRSYDPLIFGSAIAVLAVCAALAAYLPARRASLVDPVQALRTE